MKTKPLNKTSVVVVIVLAASFGITSTVSAAYSPTVSAFLFASKAKESLATKRELLEEKHKQIKFEALAAVTGAQNALMALKNNDSKRALALLKDATKHLDVLLAKKPQSNLMPAIIDADIYDFDSDTKQVEKLTNTANQLLAEHRVQTARQLLDQLVSEIHVTTISVPLGSFSMGVKDATYLASSGNVDKAEDVLYEVLNRLVKTTEIMPIPILRAADLLIEARKLEQTSDKDQEASSTQVVMMLNAAKEKLNFSEMLGYGSKVDYTEVYDAIDEMKNAVFTEKSADAWSKVSASFSGLKEKLTRIKK
jgi:urease gamma subunit